VEASMLQELTSKLYCYAITHRRASVDILDKCQIHDPSELKRSIEANELAVLQTCNRVEVYFIGNEESLKVLEELLSRKSGLDIKAYAELMRGFDAIKHLYRVACGLESMFIGEEEILGQVRGALLEAEKLGIIGNRLRLIFQGAILAGKRARRETAISRGSVSIPSVAVRKAEKLSGGLRDKTILVIGAGEAGELVVKELVKRKPNVILIANRTFDRAVKLAEKYHGQPVKLNEAELPYHLAKADVVFVATRAPHLIVKAKHLEEAVKINNHRIIIFDLAVPRNVDEIIRSKFNAEVYTIDELRAEAEENLKMRIQEIPRVEDIIEEEIQKLQMKISKLAEKQKVKEIIGSLEEIRRRELERALRKLKVENGIEKVMNLFSKALTKKISRELLKIISSEQDKREDILRHLLEILGGS